MGEESGFWLPQQHFDWQSPNLNTLSLPLEPGQQNNVYAHMTPETNLTATNATVPVYAFAELPYSRASQVNEPHGWFYCLPHFRQAFTPSNPIFKEKLPAEPYENCKEASTPNVGSACTQKRFLVFDQSGDQTTLIFGSCFGTPVKCMSSWSPKPPGAYLSVEDPGTRREPNHHLGPILNDEFNENHEIDVQSEMHEDTEELNALLYSDDDNDYIEDDEVTSTGHSPSTMTAHGVQDWFEGSAEEIASSAGRTKRQKLFDVGYDDVPLLADTASDYGKPSKCFEYDDDDAESSCAKGKNPRSGEIGFLLGNKIMKKEKIRETVSILQRIIPGGKGKDAIEILDEAIYYLKSLKLKAKALGLKTP